MLTDVPAELIPYSLETYTPHVGSEVEVLRGTEWVRLSLAAAPAAKGHVARTRESFSLLFSGGLDLPLEQGLHTFRHAAMGEFELFITPVVPQDKAHRWYEAVINRRVN
jgi:hypothetical protein